MLTFTGPEGQTTDTHVVGHSLRGAETKPHWLVISKDSGGRYYSSRFEPEGRYGKIAGPIGIMDALELAKDLASGVTPLHQIAPLITGLALLALAVAMEIESLEFREIAA